VLEKKFITMKIIQILDENIAIYGVGQHRHMPEINYLSYLSNKNIEVRLHLI
jgi:N-acetyl-gamma-glutamylphosphate reductase